MARTKHTASKSRGAPAPLVELLAPPVVEREKEVMDLTETDPETVDEPPPKKRKARVGTIVIKPPEKSAPEKSAPLKVTFDVVPETPKNTLCVTIRGEQLDILGKESPVRLDHFPISPKINSFSGAQAAGTVEFSAFVTSASKEPFVAPASSFHKTLPRNSNSYVRLVI